MRFGQRRDLENREKGRKSFAIGLSLLGPEGECKMYRGRLVTLLHTSAHGSPAPSPHTPVCLPLVVLLHLNGHHFLPPLFFFLLLLLLLLCFFWWPNLALKVGRGGQPASPPPPLVVLPHTLSPGYLPLPEHKLSARTFLGSPPPLLGHTWRGVRAPSTPSPPNNTTPSSTPLVFPRACKEGCCNFIVAARRAAAAHATTPPRPVVSLLLPLALSI